MKEFLNAPLTTWDLLKFCAGLLLGTLFSGLAPLAWEFFKDWLWERKHR